MPIQVADLTLDPPVFLAPLAGITDLPFRNLVLKFGAGLVVSEMVASQEMVTNRPLARARAELGFGNEKTAIQIAGREAQLMAECARICEANGASLIDINMGCPARKVTGGLSGSALMKDLDHALRLIEAVVAAVSVPVTLKTRLGWDESNLNAAELGKRAENAGIRMLTIHGRTRNQFYKGHADWERIADVADAVSIPVIANGDIQSVKDARQALAQSGADGVMIGRGAQGRPWLLAEIAATLLSKPAPIQPKGAELAAMIIVHYDEMLSFYGKELGLRTARKHLGWYCDGFDLAPGERRALLTETDPRKVRERIHRLVKAPELQSAA